MRKTNRVYGCKITAIRQFAKSSPQLTAEMFPWNRGSTNALLYQMYQRGELSLVSRGISGHHGKPAIYKFNEHHQSNRATGV